jgi:multidrug resistance protein MdtO
MPRADSEPEPRSDVVTQLWRLIAVELAPYPARWSLALRMAISCSIVMVLEMTFRIPGAALGAYIPFLFPRDSFQSTWRAAKATFVVCTVGAASILLTAALAAGSPMVHFFWAIGCMFAVFYCISALTVSSAAIGLGLMTAGAISIWDGTAPSNMRVTLTLYLLLSVVLGCLTTVAVEFAATRVRHRDVVLDGIRVRASLVVQLLRAYIRGGRPSRLVCHRLSQYASRGTGHLRDVLAAAGHEQHYRERIAEALAQSHELVRIASSIAEFGPVLSESDRAHVRRLIVRLQNIDRHLRHSRAPAHVELPAAFHVSLSFPALSSLERTIDLLADAFTDEEGSGPRRSSHARAIAPASSGAWFRDGQHARFAIRGGLSAMLCYIFYMNAGWRGLNASVITCFLTAVTSIGASRQRQLLRLSGVFAGGCVLGIGTQALLLPWIETLPEFAIVFTVCMAMCAWVATSGPRLAFAGVQMSLAYVLVTLSTPGINTSLLPIGDALFGIALGLAAMWLIYDHLWAVPSAKAYRRTLAAIFRRMAEAARKPDLQQLHRDREWTLRAFEEVRAFADSRVFEPQSTGEEEARDFRRIEERQPVAGALSLTLFHLLEHVETDGMRASVTAAVLERTARALSAAADEIEGSVGGGDAEESSAALLHEIETAQEGETELRVLQELRLDHETVVLLRELNAISPVVRFPSRLALRQSQSSPPQSPSVA